MAPCYCTLSVALSELIWKRNEVYWLWRFQIGKRRRFLEVDSKIRFGFAFSVNVASEYHTNSCSSGND
jgi:hypothetical protein